MVRWKGYENKNAQELAEEIKEKSILIYNLLNEKANKNE